MTVEEVREVKREPISRRIVCEIVERTRREQGLPPTVEDPVALRKIAEILSGLYTSHRDVYPPVDSLNDQ